MLSENYRALRSEFANLAYNAGDSELSDASSPLLEAISDRVNVIRKRVAFMTFEGDHWKTGWWYGDDLSMALQLNAPEEFLFPEGEISIGESC